MRETRGSTRKRGTASTSMSERQCQQSRSRIVFRVVDDPIDLDRAERIKSYCACCALWPPSEARETTIGAQIFPFTASNIANRDQANIRQTLSEQQ